MFKVEIVKFEGKAPEAYFYKDTKKGGMSRLFTCGDSNFILEEKIVEFEAEYENLFSAKKGLINYFKDNSIKLSICTTSTDWGCIDFNDVYKNEEEYKTLKGKLHEILKE